jgi:hypothetical protein
MSVAAIAARKLIVGRSKSIIVIRHSHNPIAHENRSSDGSVTVAQIE